MNNNNCQSSGTFRIRRPGRDFDVDIVHLAKRKGVTVAETLRPLLKGIADGYPPEMKQASTGGKRKTEIKIENVFYGNLKQDLSNIARNIGVDLGDFLKVKLCDQIMAMPLHLRKPLLEE